MDNFSYDFLTWNPANGNDSEPPPAPQHCGSEVESDVDLPSDVESDNGQQFERIEMTIVMFNTDLVMSQMKKVYHVQLPEEVV